MNRNTNSWLKELLSAQINQLRSSTSRWPRKLMRGFLLVLIAVAMPLVTMPASVSGAAALHNRSIRVDGATINVDRALAKKVPAAIQKTGLKDISYNDTAPGQFVKDGRLQGQEIDMGRAVAAVLGLKWHPTPSGAFTTFIPSLQNGRYNTAFTSLIVNPTRIKVIDIVSIYSVGTGFAAKPGSDVKTVKSALDLCGDSISVVQSSAYITYMNGISSKCAAAGHPGLTLKIYPNAAESELAAADGRVQLTADTATGLEYIIHQTHNLVEEPFQLDPQPEGVGVSKGKLGSLIADAVNVLIKDGAYHKIMHKWGQTAFEIKHSKNYS